MQERYRRIGNRHSYRYEHQGQNDYRNGVIDMQLIDRLELISPLNIIQRAE